MAFGLPFYFARKEVSVEDILKLYSQLLSSVDAWFSSCIAGFNVRIACTSGCSACCRGLFDITLLDAWYLRIGFDQLDRDTRAAVVEKAQSRISSLTALKPRFSSPYILNAVPENEWAEMMPDDDYTPCVLLGANGQCLVYQNRPITCRLHGLPVIDTDGDVIDDTVCTRNSVSDPESLLQIRYDFKNLFADESTCFLLFTNILFKQQIKELDTVIPAALLVDYEKFDWRTWLASADLKKEDNTVF